MTEVDHTSPYEKTFLEQLLIGLYEKLCNDVADVVIKKISENNSSWLNNIQYKVRAENIEGQIQASQIDGLEDMVDDHTSFNKNDIRDIAREEVEDVIKNCSIETNIQI